MSSWYSYLALAVFVVLVFSPTWAFGKVDQVLPNRQKDIQEEVFPHPATEVLLVGLPAVLEREEQVLKNLQYMMDTAKNPETFRIWKMKHLEYLKEIRWKKLVEASHGKARVYLHV